MSCPRRLFQLFSLGISNPRVLSDMGLAIRTLFFDYLRAQNKRNASQIVSYASRFVDVLHSGDASPILAIKSPAARHHTMEALSLLSKYFGVYQRWTDIRSRYNLKWGSAAEDNLRYFTNYLQGQNNLDVMLDWLRDTLNKLPKHIGNILLHNTLTGLRPSENLLCIKLVQMDYDNYINEDLGILENFRFPEFISKKTKKAYLTVYDDTFLEIALNSKVYDTWKAFRSKLKRCGIDAVHTKYCRAIYATWLRKAGIEQEIISLYQGRVPSTVFQASYLKTNVREDREKILRALHQLKKEYFET